MADGPYASVFKLVRVGDMRRSRTCGDVQEVMDKKIGRRAYRIKGIVSAANYLEIPNLLVRAARARAACCRGCQTHDPLPRRRRRRAIARRFVSRAVTSTSSFGRSRRKMWCSTSIR